MHVRVGSPVKPHMGVTPTGASREAHFDCRVLHPFRRRRSDLRYSIATVALAAALAVVAGSCGGDGATTPAPPPPPPNQAPTAALPISPQSLTIGTPAMVNLAEHFSDPDGDQLAYMATTSDAGVVSVSVSGSVLTLTPAREGNASVSVTARDPRGSSASQSFPVTVERPNEAPRTTARIRDQTLTEEGADVNLDLDDHFTDPDGDVLEFTATSDSTSVVSVRVSGSNLRLSPRREGTATVEVEARDPAGLTASQSFDVTVEPAGPSLELEPGGTCRIRTVGGDPEFVVAGAVRASRTVTDVVVRACVRPPSASRPDCTSSSRYYIGRDSLGTIRAGQSRRFEVSGLPSLRVVEEIVEEDAARCSVEVTWRDSSSSETTSTTMEIEAPLRRN